LATRLAVDLSPRLGGHTCVPPPTVERDRRAWYQHRRPRTTL